MLEVEDITVEELATLRSLVGDTTLTDPQLAQILIDTAEADDTLNFNAAAGVVWRRKAAGYADLVDTQESGSTRKLSQLHGNAIAMATFYEGGATGVEVVVETGRRSRTRAIRRA